MSSDRRYTQEEVDAILKRALERDRTALPADAVSHSDLLDTAREVGIGPEQVEAAIVEVKREQQALAVRQAWIERRRAALSRTAITWAVVSALCFLVSFLTTGGMWWLWVAGPWGAALLLSYMRLSQGPSERDLRRTERRLQREQRKAELEARFERGAAVLGTVVEQGANLLLAHLDERSRQRRALEAGRASEPAGRGPADRKR